MSEAPQFPPLFAGEAAAAPFEEACARAAEGVDAGLILYRVELDSMTAAMVLAPEVPRTQAAQMLVVAGVGLTNAFGALAPPEVGMRLHWDGRIEVNGANCGRLAMAAADGPPDAAPNWLVVGFILPLLPASMEAPGATPDQTSLFEEGCADLDPARLVEAWARHFLVWVNRWEEDGPKPVHAEWSGLALGIGAEVMAPDGRRGGFVGVDEDFAMLFKTERGVEAIPLTAVMETAP